MPDKPAVTTILDKIEARMVNITTGNGYNVTVKAGNITRAKLTPFKGYDLPALTFWSTSVLNEKNAYNSDVREIQLFIEIHDQTRDEPFTDVVERLAADGVTALNRAAAKPKVSDDPSYDLGNTVEDIIFNGYDYLIGEGQSPWCGVLLKFGIQYVTESFDMTTYSRS